MRTIFKYLSIPALMITTVVCSVAQSTQGRIEGSVSNEKGEPIEYATVLLRQPQDSTLIAGAITNASGQYSFESVAPGKCIITLTFVGYHKQSIPIELQDGVSIYKVPAVILKEDARVLGEVVVRAQKPLIEQDGGKLILNVQNTIIAAGSSAAELLERAPGVSIDQNNQISVNGKTGVNIMIDGKPTYLPPAELATLLRSINANNIATIEVVSNPSARYDASGNSGIINIKLKKNTLEGFNGSITAGAGYGRYGKANGSVNLNYRSGKWNHFLNYGYTFNKRYTDFFTGRTTLRNHGEPVYYTQQLDRIQRLPSHTWQGGSEWQWDPKNSIAIITSGGYNERNTDNNSFTQINSTLANEADSTYTLTNDQRYRWHNISSSIGYKHLFAREGSELSIDVDY
ncbi:MAG TPA: carboxypeptidase regulatory-like domain-containing protein, partial [Flavitalea sp.]|nr:carboxypeptidase regulatory-like domain-containing protein [Flavitalea sp.]